jgi:hypothetical protein
MGYRLDAQHTTLPSAEMDALTLRRLLESRCSSSMTGTRHLMAIVVDFSWATLIALLEARLDS